MKVFLVNTPIGLLAFDEKEKLIYSKLYEKSGDVKRIVDKFLKNVEIPDKLKKYNLEVNTEQSYRIARKHLRKIALEKLFKTNEEFNVFMREFCIELSKRRIRIEKDKLVIRAVRTLVDVNKFLNVLYQHIKEWYLLHYPEFNKEHKKIVEAIIKYGRRINIPGFKTSIGIELEEEDVEMLKTFAESIKKFETLKVRLEQYVKTLMKEIAPNISMIVDPILGARLISAAGSLEKLAKSASSTIQLLGAEKALFRHLRKKTKPPKHGLLYLDPRVQNAPKNKRGKVARIIAAKLMLAARIDFYSKELRPELKKELQQELKKVVG